MTTGISQLPRRDRASEMCFNCTLLIVVRRSLSLISEYHFHKTLWFLSHFRRLCKRHEKKNIIIRDITRVESYIVEHTVGMWVYVRARACVRA